MYIDDFDVDNMVGDRGYAWVYSYKPMIYRAGMHRREAEILKKLGFKLISGWAEEGKNYMHPDDEYIFQFTGHDRQAVFNVLGIKHY